jgi:hypothetical protein
MDKVEHPKGWGLMPGESINAETLEAVQAESIRATLKHGFENTNLNPALPYLQKLANLGEEVGEVSQIFTYDKFGPGHHSLLYTELIQVANLALGWAQAERQIMRSRGED